jgi:hypothetical protein
VAIADRGTPAIGDRHAISQSMIGVVVALTLQLIVGVATVTPPTEFQAKAEGDSFVATLRDALDKLSPSWTTLPHTGC